jgi:hypothetical protein
MKRWISVTAILVVAIASSPAAAGMSGQPGSASAIAGSSAVKAMNDFTVAFRVRYDNRGRPIKVANFRYGNPDASTPEQQAAEDVPMNCDEGPALTYTNPGGGFGPMKVKDHEFRGHFEGIGGEDGAIEVVIKGRFTHHNHRADGTLHITGDFTPTYHNCDSGVQTWKAGAK